MSFSAEWLALREPIDHASRSAKVAAEVTRHFARDGSVTVVDLGCGTGSNLRATSALLPDVQHWTLVDYDPLLLAAARKTLTTWADRTEEAAGALGLTHAGKRIRVHFRQADLSSGVGPLLAETPDLVTASALFDLISAPWLERFAADVAATGAAFYTVLTYDGRDAFLPAHPADADVIAAFARHQGGDKGFGPAAGPGASPVLEKAFGAAKYSVLTGDSPWRIGRRDRALGKDLLGGMAQAVIEAGLPAAEVAEWLAFRLASLSDADASILTGHTDIFARRA